MKAITLLLFLGLYIHFCNGKYRIFNGVTTTIKKHPHQIGLLCKKDFKVIFKCGGSIINNETIITAAHCVEANPCESSYIVKVGSTKFNNGIDVKIKKIIIHPKFDYETLTHDIAILKLKTPLIFNDTIKPIELQPKNKEIATGTKAITSGWGSINPRKMKMANELQELKVVILDKKICNSYDADSSKIICAQSKGKSVCYGDSGGPLVVNGKLVGVTSYCHGGCYGRHPFFFTKIASMREFIDQYI